MKTRYILYTLLAALGLLVAGGAVVALVLALKFTGMIPFYGYATANAAMLLLLLYFAGMMIFGIGYWYAKEARAQQNGKRT